MEFSTFKKKFHFLEVGYETENRHPKICEIRNDVAQFCVALFALMIFASILKIDFLFFQETCEFSVLPMEIGDLKASSTQIFSVLARYLSSSKFSIE